MGLQYLNGHSDVIMGALLMDSERLHSKLAAVQVFTFFKYQISNIKYQISNIKHQISYIMDSERLHSKLAAVQVFTFNKSNPP